ncbi:hypothetical protein CspeluHIS016_0110790 [Cutaneotrichosporon spelunceum]|uniref:Alpha-mannosidase n=1 Tax=Cutaneotrichosporon spelunceum TaxID=1672016 RepID=A0AAD3TP73_9TREE|nr:hypothetical protein CspeluHIS016_0110790 [Cutaneotrichosporon spelunceum]
MGSRQQPLGPVRPMITDKDKPTADNYPQLEYEARYKYMTGIDGRIDSFIGGHFSGYNLSALLFAHREDDTKHVQLEVWSAPGRSKPTFEEARKQKYRSAKKGEEFGPSWTNHWFKVTVIIPKAWEEYERIQLEFDCSGEAMVMDVDGNVYHGLTGGWSWDRRVEFIIPEKDRKKGIGHYYIEASCNGMFGQNGENPPDPNRYYRLNSADLTVPNMDAWRLKYDFDSLHQLTHEMPWDSSLHHHTKKVLNNIIDVFRIGDLSCIPDCRKAAEEILGKDWEKVSDEDNKDASKQNGQLWALGHCHIDTAWLWPFSVTQQKAARSWSTQIDLMDRYPEHRFATTQAQQYKWVEQLYPSLFKRIKEKVKEGLFQPIGCTWVEMDTNVPSGEALVRQFLYGQRYYESRFGSRSQTFVLPDTFGYSSQLPQISRLAGAPNFFTQKISWNIINKFPHTTFNWVGLDGTQVLTHMTPVNNYNSQCNMDDIRRGSTGHKNLEVTNQSLLLFGNGDGGGGPTPPMLEMLKRARAIGKRHDAGGQLPLVRMGGTIEKFYDAIRKETNNGRTLPTWHGELYLEIHRATYTTHGSIKRHNRKIEIMLREAEWATTMASLSSPKYKYPKDKIDSAWEDLLLCQFHDVLPGSSIQMVYDDAERIYHGVEKSLTKVIEGAYQSLYQGTAALSPNAKLDGKAQIVAINTLPGTTRLEVMQVPIAEHACVRTHSVQMSSDRKTGYLLMDASPESAFATSRGLYADLQPARATQVSATCFELINSSVKMMIEDGRITSLRDVALDRELIPEGMSGGLVIMEDHPNYWDAWDVDFFHLFKQKHLKFEKVRVKDVGPLRASLTVSLRYGDSDIEFDVSLDAVPASTMADARSMVRFDAHISWHQKHEFLKFELPLDIHNDVATYDTQFGTLTRPTHRNTSWDAAKFEVCAHKFADLSEYGYGVAIINDCKYGYAVDGNVMRLSLLRGPTMPDPDCDMGKHEFSFAIYPHVGTYIESDVTPVAVAFNAPMRPRLGSASTALTFMGNPFRIENARNVFLETVKRGEDDVHAEGEEQTLILRLFEQFGGHANAVLQITGLAVAKAELVNIMEDHMEDLKVSSAGPNSSSDDSEIKLRFRGYEIKTVRLTLKPGAKPKAHRDSGGWVKL